MDKMEKATMILPQVGELLRAIITRSGYRGYITRSGMDKDLDDLANGSRASSTCDLITAVENSCREEVERECGPELAQFLVGAWSKCRTATQQLARDVNTSPMADEQGREEVVRLFEIPMFSGFIQLATSLHRGPVGDRWWRSPISSWVHWAAAETKQSVDVLLANFANHLDVDPRSIERWLSGEPTQKLHWPYRPLVEATVGAEACNRLRTEAIDQLTVWLIVSVASQSLATDLRGIIRQDFGCRRGQLWTLENAIAELNGTGLAVGNPQIRAAAMPLIETIAAHFLAASRDIVAIRKSLGELQSLIAQETLFWRRSYQYIHDWFSARLAAIEGRESEASFLYEAAVEGAWWYAGPNQLPIISEALTYEVGVGKKSNVERYWDKTFLLGLNTWPKRPLDRQEIRRLSFGFERRFSPQKSKEIVPPRMEIIVRDQQVAVGKAQLANPNRKLKHAERRTRRTPLMNAIAEGTLEDVKRLLDAGGDPNDFIKESGEGPLMYAMRRACDRKDPEIMHYLLALDLLPETVNREASTKRETPLKVAIEMADSKAVERLIELGANVESRCDYVPSSLCYAMSLFYSSIYPSDRSQEIAYLNGKGRADVYDAKDGAVLDVELASRRQALLAIRQASPENENIWVAVKNYMMRPTADYRKVIYSLLDHGANANFRYRVEAHDTAEWTPTLFAAQVGDLDIFTALVENGGDPDLTLTELPFERHDALWVAVAHKRYAIIDYLKHRRQP